MKKRILSLMLVCAMVLGLLPMSVMAVDGEEQVPVTPLVQPTTVSVDFTMQAENEFLLAPQFNVPVEADLAENCGYTNDKVTDGVSALDVLVKAHAMKYEDFTENPENYLAMNESGFITKVFGVETSNFSYMVNGEMPNDGVLKKDDYSPGGQSYTGYAINECAVESGAALEFFLYQDSYYLDNYGWAEYQGSKASTITVRPEAVASLTWRGFCVAYYGCVPLETLINFALVKAIEGAQLAWVDTTRGALRDIEGAVTGEDGKVTLTAPAETGIYYLTAYVPAEENATPLVMSLVKVVVDPNAPQPEGPVVSADLTALSVADFDSNPNSLTLNPVFSSDVTSYSVNPVEFQQYAKMAYIKATAASDTAVIKASLNGGTEKTVTSGDAYWTSFDNMIPGQDNILTVTVAASDAADAEIKTYTVTIPMKAQTVAVTGITLDKTELTLMQGKTGTLTATVAPENATDKAATWESDHPEIAAVENGMVTAVGIGTATITVKAGEKSATCAVTVTEYLPDASITVPTGVELFVGSKGKAHFVPFTGIEPRAVKANAEAGTTTYYYELTNNKQYNYRVSGEDCITYAGIFKKTAGWSLTIGEEDLKPAGKTPPTMDRDLSSNKGYNVADIWLNINAQNYLKLDAVDATYQLVNLRNWEAVDSITGNYFIEPDYHYTVINESGATDNSVVTVSDSGVVTAVGEGTAIVLVTYDAININGADGGPFFGAIWPENTGVFVVSVGAGESGITTGMTINETINAGLSFKNDGTALDAEHDVIYYLGGEGSYTFTPGTDGVSVCVAQPTVSETAMSFSGFQPVSANEDGSVSVPLKEGRNIVKLEKNGKAEYQVITAKQVTVSINNGQPVVPGDTVTIKFSTVYHPINKLAGVYNYTPAIVYSQVEGYADKMVGSKGSQHTFASTGAAQTVSHFMTTREQWGATFLDTGVAFTIPADYANDTLTLSGGTIGFGGWGSWAGEHRRITPESGKLPNLNAASPFGYLGQLPELVISVTLDKTVASVEITAQPAKQTYLVGDRFDPAGMVVKATYSDDSANEAVTSYTVSPEILTADTTAVTVTYGGKTATVPVTVTQPKVTAIAITKAPNKTSYTAGDVFDPTGMVVTATYENGKTAPVTSYTYEPKRTLTESDTKMTITYTGSDKTGEVAAVEQAITVTPAPVQPEQPKTVTVSFTLLGDSGHGAPTGKNDTHTLKAGNLETWIARTSITVPQDSKVIDVMVKALGVAGIPYENPTGNYVSSIRGLAQFENGTYSGWMYTLNGKHPNLGVAEQSVSSGDVIVFHYTDDYTAEQGSEAWDGGSGSAGATTGAAAGGSVETGSATVKPEVTADKNGSATAKVEDKTVAEALKQAEKDSAADAVVVAPEIKGDASKVTVELSKTAVADIAKSGELKLTVDTPAAKITLPNGGLKELAGSEATLAVSAEKQKDGSVSIDVCVGGKSQEAISGGIAVTIPADAKDSGKVLVLVNADGTQTVIKKSAVDQDGGHAALLTGSATVKLVDNSKDFSDVEGHWGAASIEFAASHELFNGTGDGKFSPDGQMTRAMLVTTLYRLEDAKAGMSANFHDVPKDTWYSDSVAWASSSGIVTGTGNGFAPEENITREQLAAMLYRYAAHIGMDTGARGDLKDFEDGGQVSGWASDAMAWAVGSGLMGGKGSGVIDPAGTATRAEVAAVCQRLVAMMVQ